MVGGYILNNPHESKGVWIRIAGGMYSEYWLKAENLMDNILFSENYSQIILSLCRSIGYL